MTAYESDSEAPLEADNVDSSDEAEEKPKKKPAMAAAARQRLTPMRTMALTKTVTTMKTVMAMASRWNPLARKMRSKKFL